MSRYRPLGLQHLLVRRRRVLLRYRRGAILRITVIIKIDTLTRVVVLIHLIIDCAHV